MPRPWPFSGGEKEVSYEDLRQIIPFVLHDKLKQNVDAPFFDRAEGQAFRTDQVSWIRYLFDESCKEYDRLNLDREDPVAALESQFDQGLDGLTENEIKKRMAAIERLLGKMEQVPQVLRPYVR